MTTEEAAVRIVFIVMAWVLIFVCWHHMQQPPTGRA